MIVNRSSTRFPARPLRVVADLSEARAAFVGWLRAADVESEQIDDLSVVLSELGANAVRETPDGAPPAEVEAAIDGGTLRLTVTNEVADDPAAEVDDWDLTRSAPHGRPWPAARVGIRRRHRRRCRRPAPGRALHDNHLTATLGLTRPPSGVTGLTPRS